MSMMLRLVIATLVAGSSVLGAQVTPPAPPAQPVPATAPTPRTPVAAPHVSAPHVVPPRPFATPTPAAAPAPYRYEYDYDSGQWRATRSIDAQERMAEAAARNAERVFEAQSRNAETMARTAERAAERNSEAVARAAERVSERNTEAMARVAERAAEAGVYGAARAPMAMPSYSYSYSLGTPAIAGVAPRAYYEPGITPMPMPQWSQDDPADSLYRVAYDAMNRGDWRRAADQFAQVCVKFTRSSRCSSATYFEAFMHYRIGTTDELHAAQKLLVSERAKGISESSRQAEIASLNTRIRGALAARGDQEAIKQLQADAQAKGGTCDQEDIQVRTEALSALAQSDIASATPMLRKVLEKKDPCALELRRRALSILLRRADTAATAAAIAVAKNNEESLDLRTDAVSYLSRLPGDNAVATLEELLRSSNEKEIQRAAIRSLARTDNARAHAAVRALIERADVTEQLRSEAISTFDAERSTPEDAVWLRSVYAKLPSERLKISVLSAIGRIGGTENDAFVMNVARNINESSDVRAVAIGRMSRSSTVSIADLKKLYDAAESRSIREQIINVFGQRKETEATDHLIDIVKNGTDPYLRRQAISSLTRRDDPRAKQLLQEIVNK